MKLSKTMLGLGAAALVAMPAVAQVSMMPAVGPLDGEESELVGATGIILGIVAAAALIGGIIVIADDNEPELPVSN
jgi:hypothetical protein